MEKGDAGMYKFPRRNQNPTSGDNRIQQPPWKLGINSSSNNNNNGGGGSSASDVRRTCSRNLGTRHLFEEKHKQKRSFVAESSGSGSGSGSSTGTVTTGKAGTQSLVEAGEIPDFVDPSSSSSSRFLSQRNNKQINLGSGSNGTGFSTSTGMHRHSGTKCSSGTEGVRKRVIIGEGSSSVSRSSTAISSGAAVRDNNGTEAWSPQEQEEDQRAEENEVVVEKEHLYNDDDDDDDDDDDYEDEMQPSRFAFLLPHHMYASSSSSSSSSRSVRPDYSGLDSAPGMSGRTAARPPWRGEERSGRIGGHGALRLRDRDAYRRDGIAEVLLALERIEQHGEMSYAEQMMILETNFLLNGLTFRDEHRDMRMDIDSMSYEELLALEEKMGTVSTALTEEEFVNCLKKTIYHESISHSIDDIKCCICQEEYENGEEIGMLKCEHWYHVGCIREWLSQKNWCPVCKTSQNDR